MSTMPRQLTIPPDWTALPSPQARPRQPSPTERLATARARALRFREQFDHADNVPIGYPVHGLFVAPSPLEFAAGALRGVGALRGEAMAEGEATDAAAQVTEARHQAMADFLRAGPDQEHAFWALLGTDDPQLQTFGMEGLLGLPATRARAAQTAAEMEGRAEERQWRRDEREAAAEDRRQRDADRRAFEREMFAQRVEHRPPFAGMLVHTPQGAFRFDRGPGGGLTEVRTPDGAPLIAPAVDPHHRAEIAGREAAAQATGKAVAEQGMEAGGLITMAEDAARLARELEEHPALAESVGPQRMIPRRWVPGSPHMDVEARREQLQARIFLEAAQQMRGLGAMTEAEGARATGALSRLGNPWASEADTRSALREARELFEAAATRLRARRDRVPADIAPGVFTPPAQAAPAAAPAAPAAPVIRFNERGEALP